MLPCVEGEWHVFLVCPLCSGQRSALPFTARQILVAGHEVQGEGCCPRNMTALVRAVLQVPNFDSGVDYRIRVLKSGANIVLEQCGHETHAQRTVQ